jgi:dipeptidyl aminopeptidase/acylaminoacyl peptidase
MRRRLENGSYIPPFRLDEALIALGFPDRESLRYWRYSGAYHVRSDFPPLAILHSRTDEVVPYQQSELLAANLNLVGASYEIHFFDGASHYLLAEDGDADTLRIYELTLDFLARHLK